MTENRSRRDILAVVIGILLMLPVTIGLAWVVTAVIDQLVLHDPDALLAHQPSGSNSSQAEPSPLAPSDFSARRNNSKTHRDRLLRELHEAK